MLAAVPYASVQSLPACSSVPVSVYLHISERISGLDGTEECLGEMRSKYSLSTNGGSHA